MTPDPLKDALEKLVDCGLLITDGVFYRGPRDLMKVQRQLHTLTAMYGELVGYEATVLAIVPPALVQGPMTLEQIRVIVDLGSAYLAK